MENFLKSQIHEQALRIASATGDSELGTMFERLMGNTLETTLSLEADGSTFVITGDIPAMWLRDSTAQLMPFLRFLKAEEVTSGDSAPQDSAPGDSSARQLADVVSGLVKRQFGYIALDSYANAFNQEANGASYDPHDACDNPWVWEQKYEIDSFAFPISLAWQLWKRTERTDFLTADVQRTLQLMVAQLRLEQDHQNSSRYRFVRDTDLPSETLSRDGLGSPTGHTGMTWSGFRPSDDACVYGYNVPGNLFVRHALLMVAEIAQVVFGDNALADAAFALSADIAAGVAHYGVVSHPVHGRIYAYEVDGLGGELLMDDANMPSLLSLPLTGAVDQEDPLYLATRDFILSEENPYFTKGSYAEGIGSPHTPPRYIWPIALAVQGLTSSSSAEKLRLLKLLKATTGGTGMMHEGFDPDNPEAFTRPWFSWANSMFCELLVDYCDSVEEN